MTQDKQWHLSKSIPLGLVFALIVQSGAVFWWASNIDNRVSQLETDMVRSERMIENNSNDVKQALSDLRVAVEIMGRVEQDIKEVREDLRFLRENQ